MKKNYSGGEGLKSRKGHQFGGKISINGEFLTIPALGIHNP
ncbi:MAG: hypothetical protein V8Q81_03365 [Christensenellales bacterium]